MIVERVKRRSVGGLDVSAIDNAEDLEAIFAEHDNFVQARHIYRQLPPPLSQLPRLNCFTQRGHYSDTPAHHQALARHLEREGVSTFGYDTLGYAAVQAQIQAQYERATAAALVVQHAWRRCVLRRECRRVRARAAEAVLRWSLANVALDDDVANGGSVADSSRGAWSVGQASRSGGDSPLGWGGVSVRSLGTDTSLYERNGHRAISPGSTGGGIPSTYGMSTYDLGDKGGGGGRRSPRPLRELTAAEASAEWLRGELTAASHIKQQNMFAARLRECLRVVVRFHRQIGLRRSAARCAREAIRAEFAASLSGQAVPPDQRGPRRAAGVGRPPGVGSPKRAANPFHDGRLPELFEFKQRLQAVMLTHGAAADTPGLETEMATRVSARLRAWAGRARARSEEAWRKALADTGSAPPYPTDSLPRGVTDRPGEIAFSRRHRLQAQSGRWDSAHDPATGKMYYFCRMTGETRWEPPRDVIESATVESQAAGRAAAAAAFVALRNGDTAAWEAHCGADVDGSGDGSACHDPEWTSPQPPTGGALAAAAESAAIRAYAAREAAEAFEASGGGPVNPAAAGDAMEELREIVRIAGAGVVDDAFASVGIFTDFGGRGAKPGYSAEATGERQAGLRWGDTVDEAVRLWDTDGHAAQRALDRATRDRARTLEALCGGRAGSPTAATGATNSVGVVNRPVPNVQVACSREVGGHAAASIEAADSAIGELESVLGLPVASYLQRTAT